MPWLWRVPVGPCEHFPVAALTHWGKDLHTNTESPGLALPKSERQGVLPVSSLPLLFRFPQEMSQIGPTVHRRELEVFFIP